jgi:hypothetical protein
MRWTVIAVVSVIYIEDEFDVEEYFISGHIASAVGMLRVLRHRR